MIRSLERQTAVMERLVNLLPQLIASQQMLVEAIADRDKEDEEPQTYLDGSPR